MDDTPAHLRRVDQPLVGAGLKTPRAAAIAGIIFSLLLIASLWLLRLSAPAQAQDLSAWLQTGRRRVSLALSLVPFAGIAFIWFLGVLRDRLGAKEDQFFATVFLGSGLMFLGTVFVAASATGGLVLAYSADPVAYAAAPTFAFARAFTYDLMHIYAFKMAGVFMITTSTLAIRTRVTPGWIAWLGYACATVLILGSGYFDAVFFLFPSWVLLVSAYILMDNLRPAMQERGQSAGN
jgi:hypothetical protein